MALSVPASGALRISQILPTIKCSKCNEDINIHYADEHVCNSNPTSSGLVKAPESPEAVSRAIDRASTASSISVPSVSSYSTQSRSSRSSTSTKRAPSVRSTHTIQQSPPADPPSRPQYKSTASFQSFRSQSSADDATQQGSPPPRSGPSPAPTVRSNPVSSPVDGGATSPVQRSGPSPTPTVRSNPPLPSRAASPTPSSRAPSRMMAASPAPSIPVSRTPEPPAVLPPVAPLVLRKFSRSSNDPLPPQPPPPTHAPPPPDTSIGGEAGMAGVGRRAFAAVAHAALFTGHTKFGLPSPGLSPTSIYGYPGQILSTSPTSPIDGRLSTLSGYLNISTDVTSDDVPSPGAEIARTTSRSPSPVDVIDGSGERSKGKGVAGGLSSLAKQLRKDAANSSPAPEEPLQSASPEPMEEPERGRPRAVSSATSEAESETELAYGRSPSPSPERQNPSGSAHEGDGEENTIAFPRRGSNGSDHAPKRSGSQSSSHSSSSSSESGSVSGTRRIKQSAGAQTLSALREEDEDDGHSAYTSPSSAEVGGTFMVTPTPDSEEPTEVVPVTAKTLDMLGCDTNRLGLPTRSKTSASASSTTSSVRRKRIRTCAKCEKRIDDGRWIKIDEGNSVLCEQDWKMMYLPKCRQCGLAIETQAIYASDGQLKGKYHKECFNCYTCHKPFPDRTFYVHQERPYCNYHYHEANNSLCAAPSCREPIEGPCAVSHSGDRYHPEHFTCQYEDSEGKCETLLKEYWELDGQRMCERHAVRTESQKEDTGERTVKAKKRQTQFLDLSRSRESGANDGQGLC